MRNHPKIYLPVLSSIKMEPVHAVALEILILMIIFICLRYTELETLTQVTHGVSKVCQYYQV